MFVKITFYGYPDNDDGDGHFGTAVIAHRLQWQGRPRYVDQEERPYAGGIGTFDDPITAAASSANSVFPPGTLVYVPGLKKYFFLEDECASCDEEEWLDLWMETHAGSDPELVEWCESEWTEDDTLRRLVVIDPPPDLEVDPSPFIDASTGQCRQVLWWERPAAGRSQTSPNPADLVVTVSGTSVTGVNFGSLVSEWLRSGVMPSIFGFPAIAQSCNVVFRSRMACQRVDADSFLRIAS